jgi:putative DNA primase/helicase
MADTKKAFHEQVAEKLIEQLRQGTAPWQRPWEAGEAASLLPINPTTGKRYRGINAIQLLSQGRVDQRWLTYKQAVAAGAQVPRRAWAATWRILSAARATPRKNCGPKSPA